MRINRKVMYILGAVGVLSLAVIVGMVALVFFMASSIPYSFTNEQLTTDYLAESVEIGDYQLIQDERLPNNPIENGDSLIAYYSQDGSIPANDAVSVVIASSSLTELENVRNSLDGVVCNDFESNQSGQTASAEYAQGQCDDDAYYLYVSGSNWIVFNSPDGLDAVHSMIEAYTAE